MGTGDVPSVKRFFPDASEPGGMRESMFGEYVLLTAWVDLLQRLEVAEKKLWEAK